MSHDKGNIEDFEYMGQVRPRPYCQRCGDPMICIQERLEGDKTALDWICLIHNNKENKFAMMMEGYDAPFFQSPYLDIFNYQFYLNEWKRRRLHEKEKKLLGLDRPRGLIYPDNTLVEGIKEIEWIKRH